VFLYGAWKRRGKQERERERERGGGREREREGYRRRLVWPPLARDLAGYLFV